MPVYVWAPAAALGLAAAALAWYFLAGFSQDLDLPPWHELVGSFIAFAIGAAAPIVVYYLASAIL